MIGTQEECKLAASQLEYPYKAEVETTELMKGCFLSKRKVVKFNKISASSDTALMADRHGICKNRGICVCIYIQLN
jgi:hypothetical protein